MNDVSVGSIINGANATEKKTNYLLVHKAKSELITQRDIKRLIIYIKISIIGTETHKTSFELSAKNKTMIFEIYADIYASIKAFRIKIAKKTFRFRIGVT